MTSQLNEFRQPVGIPLEFTGPWPSPHMPVLQGRSVRLEAAHADHAQGLFSSFSHDTSGKNWTYMPTSPTGSFDEFNAWYLATCFGDDPRFYVVVDQATDIAIGVASYLRINPRDGSIEVGWISMSPLMQRSIKSTEAMFLMMQHVFDDLGYRRYEWKCDALNAPSRAAAQRLGFTFEGIFRQCTHYKGRNRDTAWLAIIDGDWPAQKARFQAYLDPDNFDDNGQQIKPLQAH
ncbi:MAG: GNAT family N-acetyltransferase [Planktomarina sp.]